MLKGGIEIVEIMRLIALVGLTFGITMFIIGFIALFFRKV